MSPNRLTLISLSSSSTRKHYKTKRTGLTLKMNHNRDFIPVIFTHAVHFYCLGATGIQVCSSLLRGSFIGIRTPLFCTRVPGPELLLPAQSLHSSQPTLTPGHVLICNFAHVAQGTVVIGPRAGRLISPNSP